MKAAISIHVIPYALHTTTCLTALLTSSAVPESVQCTKHVPRLGEWLRVQRQLEEEPNGRSCQDLPQGGGAFSVPQWIRAMRCFDWIEVE